MDAVEFMHASHVASELLTRSSLIAGLKEFSAERWRNFVLVYSPLLKYWIQRKRVHPNAVDDVLQESLQSIVAGIVGFERDAARGRFRGWLRTIVERRVADHFRTKPAELLAGPELLRSVPNPLQKDPEDIETEQQLFDEMRLRAMELVRQSTAERTWQMFWQSVVEQVPTAEVARQFGVSNAAVRVARQRVLQRLRQLMVEDFDRPSQEDSDAPV